MSYRDQLRQATVLRDLSVPLGYVSAEAEKPDDSPVELLQLDPIDVGLVQNKDSSPAWYDPIARQLYTHSLLESVLNQGNTRERAFAASIVQAHEPAHRQLADLEFHFYDDLQFSTFSLSLIMVEALRRDAFWDHLDPESASQNLEDFKSPEKRKSGKLGGGFVFTVYEALSRFHLTEFAHEISALKSQRRFIRNFDDLTPPQRSSILDDLAYGKKLEESIPSADIHDDVANNPEHSFADWLGNRLENLWEIDILEYSFRYCDDYQYLQPDKILLLAASISPNSISGLDEEGQLRLLSEYVQSFDSDIKYLILDGSVRGDISTISSSDHLNQRRKYAIQEYVDAGLYWMIPLLATQYPDQPKERTLWHILNNLSVMTIGSTHRLFLPQSVHQWATDTKLLDLAIDLWKLRGQVFLSVFRELRQSFRRDYESVVKLGKNIYENKSFGITEALNSTLARNNDQNWRHIVDPLVTRRENIHDEFVYLIDTLDELGRSIITGHDDLDRYY